MKIKALLGLSFLFVLASCATIMSGTSQLIYVQAIDKNTHKVIPDAKCSLTNNKGVIFPIQTNPGTVTVVKEYGGLTANCVAKGYRQNAVGTGESFNAWTLVDIIFWPSFFVDAATGAAKKYPSHITVLMQH